LQAGKQKGFHGKGTVDFVRYFTLHNTMREKVGSE
jgi:hypothetical protein